MIDDTKARFTTSYIPSSPGLDGSFDVPLGFILSPMAFANEYNRDSESIRIIGDQTLQSLPTTASTNHPSQRLSNNDIISCEACSSHLNKYCSYDHRTGEWTCPICYHVNELSAYYDDQAKRQLIHDSDVVEYHQTLLSKTRQPNGFIQEHKKITNTQLTMIVIDGNLPSDEVQSIFQHLSSILTPDAKKYVGLIIYTSVVNIYQLGLRGNLASADVYTFHQNANDMSDEYFDKDQDSIYVRELNDDTNRMYVGSFAQATLCASTYFGFWFDDSTPTVEEPTSSSSSSSSSKGNVENDMNTGNQITDKGNTGVKSNNPNPSRKEILRQNRINRQRDKNMYQELDLDECALEQSAQFFNSLSNKGGSKSTQQYKRKKRCSGEALAHAATLAAKCIYRNQYDVGRILLFTNGCTNFGKGNVTEVESDDTFDEGHAMNSTTATTGTGTGTTPTNISTPRIGKRGDVIDPEQLENACNYFSQIGKECFDVGIGIDVFCSGSGETLGSQAFLSLVKCSSGYVLSHADFNGEEFKANLKYVLAATQVYSKEVKCILDIRMSSGIVVKSVNGSANMEVENDVIAPIERSDSVDVSEALDVAHTRLQLGRFDPKSTVSVMVQVDEPLEEEGVVFQFILYYVNPNDSSDLITRVVTQRLEVVDEDHGPLFFHSLEKDVLPVLLAKEAAYRCMADVMGKDKDDVAYAHEDIEDLVLSTQEELDTTAYRILDACDDVSEEDDDDDEEKYEDEDEITEIDIEQRAFLSQQKSFPELEIILKRLHHFRRGTILGTNTQSSDDRALIRDLFLRLPLRDCLALMVPELWMYYFDNDGEIVSANVPAETLVLLDDNCVIAADNFETMYIWSGRGTQSSEHDILRNRCQYRLKEASKYRFPSPVTFTFNEGDSMARRFMSKLVPSHGDNVEDWVKNFPLLATREVNDKKFRMYDKSSGDSSYRHWFDYVTNDKAEKWEDRKSLCHY